MCCEWYVLVMVLIMYAANVYGIVDVGLRGLAKSHRHAYLNIYPCTYVHVSVYIYTCT